MALPHAAARDAAHIREEFDDALAAARAERDALAAQLARLDEQHERDEAAGRTLGAELDAERAAGRVRSAQIAALRERLDALTPRYQDLLRLHVATLQGRTVATRRETGADHHALPTVRFNLEQPNGINFIAGEVEIRGWCFDLEADVDGIEIAFDDVVYSAQIGVERADVADSYPEARSARTSGFLARVELAPGPHFMSVRATIEGNRPVVLLERVVNVVDGNLVCALDAPALDGLRPGTMRFSGWCWHRDRAIATLTLHVGDRATGCRYGLVRDDVAASFPEIATARRSGFVGEIDISPGTAGVVLEALLQDGSRVQTILRSDARIRASLVDIPALAPLRLRVQRVFAVRRLAVAWVRRRGRLPRLRELPGLANKAYALLHPTGALARPGMPRGWQPPPRRDPYDEWQDLNRFTPARAASLRRRLARAPASLPLISVVMPVYNPDASLLARAIASVAAQVHERWELCIADDCSATAGTRELLDAAARGDPRIRLVFRPVNGNISAATNSAAAVATGDFLLFLDQDDELAPDALGEFALRIAEAPETDLLYSDDDKFDAAGRRYAPQFKPDWSPELLLSYMYMSHALVVRRELFERLGGFRAGFEGSQDHDFALRAGELARRVAHLPQILYHWRATAGSTALDANAKPQAFAAAERAVREALARRGSDGTAARPAWAIRGALGIVAHEFPDTGPLVSILIPTRNHAAVLRRCIDSLAQTTYERYEVVVIDNGSDDPGTLAYLGALPHRVLRIGGPDEPFNYANINNRAAAAVTGDYVLFLNNDTEVREPQWLSRMVGYARMPGVGAVGARLLYPDGRIQHAGVIHGLYDGLVGPAFKLQDADDPGYLCYAKVARNYSAVTAACMLTDRHLFLAQGGFDETNFAVAYNDVDYCYRLVDAGLRCVYAPGAELLHHEGHSRGFDDRPREVVAFRRKYRQRYDPWYSPHLSLDDERFALQPRRFPREPRERPIRALMCGFTLNWEGAPYQQLELTLALRREGVLDPVVFAPTDGPLRAEYERHGITVHILAHPLREVATVAEFDAAIGRFADWIGTLGVELVYANTMESFFAVAAAARLPLPSVWNIHESEPWQSYFVQFPDAVAGRALDCFALPYRVIFVAHATRERYGPLESRHHFTTIHNGLDPQRLHAVAAGRPREEGRARLAIADDEIALLLLGTVCERKGQIDLVQALSGLDEQLHSRIRCFIVGDRPSPYSGALHALLANLPPSLRERVHVVAETSDTALYYNSADIFVCTSRVESYPRVILEAMSYGLPIVSTPVFGIREQIRNNVNGVFYEPGDIPALRLAIARLMRDQALRARLAGNARDVLAGLTDFDEMAARYAQVFAEACAG